jgi:hypothetical protein
MLSKMYTGLHKKTVILVRFNKTWIFSTNFRKIRTRFINIRLVKKNCSTRTDRHDVANSRFSQFWERTLKNYFSGLNVITIYPASCYQCRSSWPTSSRYKLRARSDSVHNPHTDNTHQTNTSARQVPTDSVLIWSAWFCSVQSANWADPYSNWKTQLVCLSQVTVNRRFSTVYTITVRRRVVSTPSDPVELPNWSIIRCLLSFYSPYAQLPYPHLAVVSLRTWRMY